MSKGTYLPTYLVPIGRYLLPTYWEEELANGPKIFQSLLPILPILFSLIPLPCSRLLFAARKKERKKERKKSKAKKAFLKSHT
jgi:hypothetical protein